VTKNKIEAWLDDEQIVDADLEGKKITIRNEVNLSRPFGFASYATTGEAEEYSVAGVEEAVEGLK